MDVSLALLQQVEEFHPAAVTLLTHRSSGDSVLHENTKFSLATMRPSRFRDITRTFMGKVFFFYICPKAATEMMAVQFPQTSAPILMYYTSV